MPITSFTVSKKGCLMPLISATMVWGGIVEPENWRRYISCRIDQLLHMAIFLIKLKQIVNYIFKLTKQLCYTSI